MASAKLRLNQKTLCKGLPYHIIIDQDFHIAQLGVFLSKKLKLDLRARCTFDQCFDLFVNSEKKRVKESKDLSAMVGKNVKVEIKRNSLDDKKPITICGQFVRVKQTTLWMFLGSPCVTSLAEMRELGMYLSDIPVHDATLELVLLDKAAENQERMRLRMENLQLQIQTANDEVEEERKKNVHLLEMLFPSDIAQRLWQDQPIRPSLHDHVTLLFSDLVGFTNICSTASASEVVEMLDALYGQFDATCGLLDVYKVETIGDGYCCVCGLQSAQADHQVAGAERVAGVRQRNAARAAWMGLEMLRCAKVTTDHRGDNIKMRVGVHTGTVLTGVVGKTMPKYCLFGADVTIANRMESTGSPGRLHASPSTYKCLVEYGGFVLEPIDVSTLPKAVHCCTSQNHSCYVNAFTGDVITHGDVHHGQTMDSHDAIMHQLEKETLDQTLKTGINTFDQKSFGGSCETLH